jgi:hypothetical protein
VVEETTGDEFMGIVEPIIEDTGADTVASVTFDKISLITGEITGSVVLVTFIVVEDDDALLFAFGFSMLFLVVFLGGGLTISESNFPLLKSMH